MRFRGGFDHAGNRRAKSAVRLLALAALVAAAAPLPTFGQAPAPAPPATALTDATQREIQSIQDLMVRASAEFEGPQQGRSIVIYDEAIARLETLQRITGGLPTRGRDMLVEAYERRARGYFSIGLQEKASESFRLLVQLKPDHNLTKETVSPKVIDLFASVKKALVAELAVASSPPGAKVTLISGTGERTELGLTDFFPIEILAGDYTVEVVKEGYSTETRMVSLAPRATEALEIPLTRTLASVFFITEPAGVEIWVDGELRATTGGSLAPDLHDVARARGLEPSRASTRTEIANLSLGSHLVELRKKCYESVKTQIETSVAQDYVRDPVRLEDSQGSLRLTSDPPGARILINGDARGVTPAELEGVCSGNIRLEVKHQAGRFIQDLVLAKDESLTLDCPIRPSLAFLGVVADTPAGERVLADADEKLRENLQRITTLNFIPAPRETVDRILEGEHLTRRSLAPGSSADPDVIRRVSEKLAQALEVEGLLVAVLPEERLQRTAVLHLLAAGNAVAEAWDVTFGEAASYVRYISKVDQRVAIYKPWSGLITVDTLLHEGVPVLRVVPGSPAAAAGVQVGEIVVSADGKPIKRTAELLAAVAGKRAREKLTLQLKGPAGSRSLDLALGETPQQIPLFEPTLFYNKVMMDLRRQVDGYPGTEQAAFGWLNLALAAMHFQDYAAAHMFLGRARAELPMRPGLSQGTALYYLGVALERLNYKSQAAEAYREAAGHKEATLINNDGPKVAPLAARRGGL
jgi:tetratricopeptide (TPR) repeat protein